jgi:hypothetical protein
LSAAMIQRKYPSVTFELFSESKVLSLAT